MRDIVISFCVCFTLSVQQGPSWGRFQEARRQRTYHREPRYNVLLQSSILVLTQPHQSYQERRIHPLSGFAIFEAPTTQPIIDMWSALCCQLQPLLNKRRPRRIYCCWLRCDFITYRRSQLLIHRPRRSISWMGLVKSPSHLLVVTQVPGAPPSIWDWRVVYRWFSKVSDRRLLAPIPVFYESSHRDQFLLYCWNGFFRASYIKED